VLSRDLIDREIYGRLTEQIRKSKCATTYLFTGEEEEKKKALARAFAKALNCENQSFDLECTCDICRRIDDGNFSDVTWYGLDEEINSLKIGQIREFIHQLGLKPVEGKTKVFIFNQAELLTPDAQNALLKSLEEPPPGNVIILLVPHARNLFDTIISRAVEVKVLPFKDEELSQILIDEGIAPSEADYLARISRGNLKYARKAHDQEWFEERKQWVSHLSRDPISFLDQFTSSKRDQALEVYDFLIEWSRDLLVTHASGGRSILIYAEQLYPFEQLVSQKDFDSLFELFENLTMLRKSIDENGNVKLTLTQTQVVLERFLKT